MHVLAKGTLPSTNVHSGNPFIDEQAVSSNLLDLHASCWRNDHLYWTYTPEPPTASTKFTGKSGDVPLVAIPDHLIFHHLPRRWYENLATTDYVHCRTPLPQTATMLTSGPFIFLLSTCPAKHAPRSHLLSTSSHPMTWSVQNVNYITWHMAGLVEDPSRMWPNL